MNTTPDNMPTELLQASTVEAIDELLRRGVGLDEPCHQTGVSGRPCSMSWSARRATVHSPRGAPVRRLLPGQDALGQFGPAVLLDEVPALDPSVRLPRGTGNVLNQRTVGTAEDRIAISEGKEGSARP